MPHPSTPLKFLAPGWFSIVMGLCGLALAWHRAVPLMGEAAGAGALVLAALAGLAALVLTVATLLRMQRYPKAVSEDFRHPVRHVFVAAMPIALLLLATATATLFDAGPVARALWLIGAAWQFGVTVWVLSRWLDPSVGGNKPGATFWPGVTPALILPVVGNVLAPLAGVALGYPGWSAAQFGLGLLFWPLIVLLLVTRIGVAGLWPERLLVTNFITVAPPSVVGLAALQMGASEVMAWMAWGIGLFFVAWSASTLRRALSQPFGIQFWAMSFPLAAFSALTLRLAQWSPPWFQALAMMVLALASLVVAALVLATYKGLRDGSLLAPEPVAMLGTPGESANR